MLLFLCVNQIKIKMRPPKQRLPKPSKSPKLVRSVLKNKNITFGKPKECWNHSTTHIEFFKELGCFNDYHKLIEGCKLFDEWIEKFATKDYRKTFFNFYDIISKDGRLPGPEYYTKDIIIDETTQRTLSRCFIVKKDIEEVELPKRANDRRKFTSLFGKWPETFNVDFVKHGNKRNLQKVKSIIQTCTEYRIWFRNICVRKCSSNISTHSHDKFLLILQILLAKLERN
jgi:hypothetical protein